MPQEPKYLSVEDVMALIQLMNDQNQKNLITAIQELKKPNEREAAELAQKDAIFKAKREERLRMGAAQEQQRLMKMLSCGHVRPDGKHTWTGQVNSNNTFTPTCNQCWSQLPKIPVTISQVRDGVNLNTYQGLNAEALIEWHKKSYNGDCGNSDCIGCHPERLNAMRNTLRERALKAQQMANQQVTA